MAPPKTLTLYHNPRCGTSRTVLGMLQGSGQPFEVVDYLKAGWTRDQLNTLLGLMDAEPRAILRIKEPMVKEKGLDRPEASGDAILQAMIADPILVERPIVSGPKGTAVCRPADRASRLI